MREPLRRPAIKDGAVLCGAGALIVAVDRYSIGAMGAGNLLGLAYVPNPIPEPTSLALVGIGAAAVWIRRRRKAK